MIIYAEACFFCKHLYEENKNGRQSEYKCSAFPQGVPEDIYKGDYDHHHPYPNDLGIRFELQSEFMNQQEEVNYVFERIEERRTKQIETPRFRNPLSYDWNKKISDDN
jgi:hypothetical protein